jgi:hypothetical protein
MNSTIAFLDGNTFLAALTALELTSTPHYVPDMENMTITCECDAERDDVVALLAADGLYPAPADGEDDDVSHYPAEIAESMDGDFDTAMASAGFGTDEDYGCFGGCEDE